MCRTHFLNFFSLMAFLNPCPEKHAEDGYCHTFLSVSVGGFLQEIDLISSFTGNSITAGDDWMSGFDSAKVRAVEFLLFCLGFETALKTCKVSFFTDKFVAGLTIWMSLT